MRAFVRTERNLVMTVHVDTGIRICDLKDIIQQSAQSSIAAVDQRLLLRDRETSVGDEISHSPP
jgi:hypothetical protein